MCLCNGMKLQEGFEGLWNQSQIVVDWNRAKNNSLPDVEKSFSMDILPSPVPSSETGSNGTGSTTMTKEGLPYNEEEMCRKIILSTSTYQIYLLTSCNCTGQELLIQGDTAGLGPGFRLTWILVVPLFARFVCICRTGIEVGHDEWNTYWVTRQDVAQEMERTAVV